MKSVKPLLPGLLLVSLAGVSWGEDKEPLVLHCVYESSVGNTKGTTNTSSPLDSGIRVPIREQETLKISNNLIEHAYESPTPIIDRTDDFILGRTFNSELWPMQTTLIVAKRSDFTYSVIRSWLTDDYGYLDWGTCTKF